MPASATTFPRTGPFVPPKKDKKKEAGGTVVADKYGKKFGRYTFKEVLKKTPFGDIITWADRTENPLGELKKEIKQATSNYVLFLGLGPSFRENPLFGLWNLTQNAPKTIFLTGWNGVVMGEWWYKRLGYEKHVQPKIKDLAKKVLRGQAPNALITAEYDQSLTNLPFLGRALGRVKGAPNGRVVWTPRQEFKLFGRTIISRRYAEPIAKTFRGVNALINPLNWLSGDSFAYFGWQQQQGYFLDRFGLPLTDFNGNLVRQISVKTPDGRVWNIVADNISPSSLYSKVRTFGPGGNRVSNFFSALGNQLSRVSRGGYLLRQFINLNPMTLDRFGWIPESPFVGGNIPAGALNIPADVKALTGNLSQFSRILYYLHPRNLLNGNSFLKLGYRERVFINTTSGNIMPGLTHLTARQGILGRLGQVLYQLHPRGWFDKRTSLLVNRAAPWLRQSPGRLRNVWFNRASPWLQTHGPAWWQVRMAPWLHQHGFLYLRPRPVFTWYYILPDGNLIAVTNPNLLQRFWFKFISGTRFGNWLYQRRQWQQQAFSKGGTALAAWWTGWFLKTRLGKILLKVWNSPVVQRIVHSWFGKLIARFFNNGISRFIFKEIIPWFTSPEMQLLNYLFRFSKFVTAPIRKWLKEKITDPIKGWLKDKITDPAKKWVRDRITDPVKKWAKDKITDPAKRWIKNKITDPFKNFLRDKLLDPIKKWLSDNLITPLKNFLQRISSQSLRQILSKIWQGLLSNLNNLWTAFLNGPIGSALSSAWTSLTGWISSTAAPALTGFLSSAWATVSGAVGAAWTSLMGSLGIGGGTAAGGAGLGTTLAGIAGAVGGAIGTVMAAVGTVTTTIIGGIAEFLAAPEELVILIVVLIIVLIALTIILLVTIIWFGYIIVTTKAPPAQELGVTVALEKKVKIDHLWTNSIATADGQDHLVEFFLYARSLTDKKATDFKIHDIDINGQSRDFNLGTGFELGGGEVKEIEAARYGVNLNASYPRIVTNVFNGQATVDGNIVKFSNVANVIIDPSLISELPPCGSPTTGTITTLFGQVIVGGPEPKHTGVDIASDLPFWKQDVYSPMDGAVSAAISGPFKGMVSVKSVNGLYQVDFVHLSNYVNVLGAAVHKGDKIGETYIGPIPGYSSGTHLHYRVKKNGQIVDPMNGEYFINTRAIGEHINVTQDCGTWTPH